MIHAACAAFYSGLQAALSVSAALVLAAGLFTLITIRKPGHAVRWHQLLVAGGRIRPQRK
jgi:hypothetical protein